MLAWGDGLQRIPRRNLLIAHERNLDALRQAIQFWGGTKKFCQRNGL